MIAVPTNEFGIAHVHPHCARRRPPLSRSRLPIDESLSESDTIPDEECRAALSVGPRWAPGGSAVQHGPTTTWASAVGPPRHKIFEPHRSGTAVPPRTTATRCRGCRGPVVSPRSHHGKSSNILCRGGPAGPPRARLDMCAIAMISCRSFVPLCSTQRHSSMVPKRKFHMAMERLKDIMQLGIMDPSNH
jgi:hypothetical protein